MTRGVRIAYLLVLGALVVAGFLFVEAPWWALAVTGGAAMLPVTVADIGTSERRASTG